jgi:voltage-gated sodium channel
MNSLHKIRQYFLKIRNNTTFEWFVISIIILSALVIGAKTYNISPEIINLLDWLDKAVTLFFLVEILIRLFAEQKLINFFKKSWNVFDFVIVTASLIPIDESELVLLARLLRIFRVLRLVSLIPELRMLLNALMKSIPRMGYVVLLMFIIFYIYAAFGSYLFDTINPILWGDISVALLTLFRVATFEDWTDVMYETMEVYPFSWIFYLTFIFLASFVFLNMMIGIILDVMQEEHETYNKENDLGSAGEVHWLKEHGEMIEHRLEKIEQLLTEQNASKK